MHHTKRELDFHSNMRPLAFLRYTHLTISLKHSHTLPSTTQNYGAMEYKNPDYINFLENKIVVAEEYGFKSDNIIGNLLPHAQAITKWCIEGGRRAIFASFGLTKTAMQLELAYQCIRKENKPFLICLPLGVVGEFKRDNSEFFNSEIEIQYITDTDCIDKYELKIYVTNYERVRMGDIDPKKFCGVSFDEASILRNLGTETTTYILANFKKIKYRFVATATPTPNDYIEILNYADFLGVIDRGHALTRFFKRDSTSAGNLTLYENKEEEFWQWVSSWAVFINKPSDLGFSDEGYNLPKLNINEVEVENISDKIILNKSGNPVLFKDTTKSLVDVSREKGESIQLRVDKCFDIIQKNGPDESWILWHHREAERTEIEKKFKQSDLRSVYGSQSNIDKEKLIIDFSNGKYKILSTKPKIAGSGCNFQHACNNMVFVGIDYKFNDFIQAIHRVFRFRQTKEVNAYIIFTQNEREVLKTLFQKWRNHIKLQENMVNIVRKYGLNTNKITEDMKRQIFEKERMHQIGGATVYNNDTTIVHDRMEDNSTGFICTSIPFGDHYEYSDNYNDFGHNNGNEEFFKQMDFLTPNLLRTLKPGRVAAIHVKDRIRYSYQNGFGFTTIDDFSGQTVAHFQKHGFALVGKITITTDVVRENNQTYRLTWGEQRKDSTKMGVGLPEYVLLFRKPQTDKSNGYADEPVTKKIDEYLLSLWQLDAHAYWKSSGDRFLSSDELQSYGMDTVFNAWKKYDKTNIYDFQEHLRVCEDLEKSNRLSKLFMAIPPTSSNDLVWTDINRMNTLNANQVNRKKEKHICPLQLDIIRRLITRFTNEGDLVDDPFGGLFSTPYVALEMKRRAVSAELNSDYYDDGLFYLKSIEYKINAPTLFSFENIK